MSDEKKPLGPPDAQEELPEGHRRFTCVGCDVTSTGPRVPEGWASRDADKPQNAICHGCDRHRCVGCETGAAHDMVMCPKYDLHSTAGEWAEATPHERFAAHAIRRHGKKR